MDKMQKVWEVLLNKATWGLIFIGAGLSLIATQSLPALGNLGLAGMVAGYTAVGAGALMLWNGFTALGR